MIEKLLLMGGLLLSPRYAINTDSWSATGRINNVVYFSGEATEEGMFDPYNGNIAIDHQYIQAGNILSIDDGFFAEGQDSLTVDFDLYNSYILDGQTDIYLTLQYEFIASTNDNLFVDKFRVYYEFDYTWEPGAVNVMKLLVGRNFGFDFTEISYCAVYDGTQSQWESYNYENIFNIYDSISNGKFDIVLSFTAEVYNSIYNPAPSQGETTVITQEVVDFNGLVFDMITLPFTWLSTFLDFKFFPGTPYEFNLSVVIMSLLTIVALLSIFLFVLKFIKG